MTPECIQHTETFMDLVVSVPHWEFELLLEFLTGLVGAATWPLLRRFWKWLFHRHDECCVTPKQEAKLPPNIPPGQRRDDPSVLIKLLQIKETKP